VIFFLDADAKSEDYLPEESVWIMVNPAVSPTP